MRSGLSIALVVVVSVNTAASQALLKHAMASVQMPQAIADLRTFLLACALSPAVWLSIGLQGIGYLAWLTILAREQLAISVALSGVVFYASTAVVAWFAFGERLSTQQWCGLVFIATGGALISWRTA